MKMIPLIRIINRLSLVFAIVNFIVANMGYENSNSFLYIWLCFISFCIYILKDIKYKRMYIPFVIMFFPLLVIRSVNEALVVITLSAYSLFYVFKDIRDIDYDNAVDEIKQCYVIIAAFIFLSLLSFNIDIFERVSWYYVIIFIASSIVYLRNLRSLKFGNSDIRANKINNISSLIICIFTSIISIRPVRDALIRLIIVLYNKAIDAFIFISSWFFLLVGNLVMLLINAAKEFIAKIIKRYGNIENQMGNSSYNKIKPPKMDQQSIADMISKNPYIMALLKLLIIIIVLYIIYRLLKNKWGVGKDYGDFVETREYIGNKSNIGSKTLSRVKEFLKPKNCEEYIRYCYRNFLRLSSKNGTIIEKSDTTIDINEKNKYIFNNEALDNLRKFYIKVRYGNASVDKSSLKLFNNYYRNIRK